jgi:hypothetical protein
MPSIVSTPSHTCEKQAFAVPDWHEYYPEISEQPDEELDTTGISITLMLAASATQSAAVSGQSEDRV